MTTQPIKTEIAEASEGLIPFRYIEGRFPESGCILCGRKVGKSPALVHYVEGPNEEYGIGNEWLTIVADADDRSFDEGSPARFEDLYWFPIGSECKKRVAGAWSNF